MKSILAISGSASSNSSNEQLLNAIAQHFSGLYKFKVFVEIREFPLFTPELQQLGFPSEVALLKTQIAEADAIIISTPEYLHNMPAVLKNALEWMTESGELHEKPVLPITFTPAPPRGEFAMKSLVQSLKASKARIVAELPLYRIHMTNEKGVISIGNEDRPLISEALNLL